MEGQISQALIRCSAYLRVLIIAYNIELLVIYRIQQQVKEILHRHPL